MMLPRNHLPMTLNILRILHLRLYLTVPLRTLRNSRLQVLGHLLVNLQYLPLRQPTSLLLSPNHQPPLSTMVGHLLTNPWYLQLRTSLQVLLLQLFSCLHTSHWHPLFQVLGHLQRNLQLMSTRLQEYHQNPLHHRL